MGLLERRLLGHGHLQGLDSAPEVAPLLVGLSEPGEQFQMQPPKLSPLLFCPLLELIGRQQLPGEQVERRPVGRRVPGAAGRSSSLREGVDIHPEIAWRTQYEPLVLAYQVVRADNRVEGLACKVENFAQVVGGCLLPQIRPQKVHRALAMEPVPRGQGKQLDQARRLPQAPRALLDRPDPRPRRRSHPAA